MKAADIIKQISIERGIDSLGIDNLDLVPLNDLNIHKREVWSLCITIDPEKYFLLMDKKYKNKSGHYCKFPINDLEEGKELCHELSKNFGTPPCETISLKNLNPGEVLYLAIHIHSEFSFTPKIDKSSPVTQDLVLNFDNS